MQYKEQTPGRGDCLGDDCCHTKATLKVHQKKPPPVCNTTIHKHVEFWHMCMCVGIADYYGQALSVLNSIKMHFNTAYKMPEENASCMQCYNLQAHGILTHVHVC